MKHFLTPVEFRNLVWDWKPYWLAACDRVICHPVFKLGNRVVMDRCLRKVWRNAGLDLRARVRRAEAEKMRVFEIPDANNL